MTEILGAGTARLGECDRAQNVILSGSAKVPLSGHQLGDRDELRFVPSLVPILPEECGRSLAVRSTRPGRVVTAASSDVRGTASPIRRLLAWRDDDIVRDSKACPGVDSKS